MIKLGFDVSLPVSKPRPPLFLSLCSCIRFVALFFAWDSSGRNEERFNERFKLNSGWALCD